VSSRRPQVTIPEPYEDVKSLRASVMAIKELVEELAGQRGKRGDFAVTFDELAGASLGEQTVPGVWNPVLIPTTGAFAAATQANVGHFAKSGRVVRVWYTVGWTALSIGSAAGNALITGLPFVPSDTAGTYWPGFTVSYSVGSSSNPTDALGARFDRNIYLYFRSSLNGAPTNFQCSHLTASGYIWGSGVYLTDN
jgi:hypothetical protein